MSDNDYAATAQPENDQQHQVGTVEVPNQQAAIEAQAAQEKRADRLLRLCEQLGRAGGTIDTGLRDMLAEVTAMEAAYMFADQMSYSETVLPEYRRTHRPSKGRGNNKTYGPELGKQAAINGAAAIMYGRALGIGMTQALQVIHNINGKSGIEARTMQALCEKAGVVFTFDPTNDHEQATVGAERPGHKPVSSTWTMEHAQQRGYTNNPLYNSHPDEMLRAKALAETCRLIAPDVVLGLAFTYEEIQLDASTTVEVPPAPTPSATVQGAKGMAALGARVAQGQGYVQQPGYGGAGGGGDRQRAAQTATSSGQGYGGGGLPPQPMYGHVVDVGQDPAHAQGRAMVEAEQRRVEREAREEGWPQQDHSVAEDAVARVEAQANDDAPQEPEAPASLQSEDWTTDEKALTVLHTALGKAGFEHRSQKLGIVGALLDREIDSTKHITDKELGYVNHTLQVWAREGAVAERCQELLRGGHPELDNPVRATTKELQQLRRAYKDHLKITGADMLPHLSNVLGWEVDDINKLSGDDVAEAIRVAEGQADRG